MQSEYCFTVPAVPSSVNHYTAVRRGGGRYKTAASNGFTLLVLNEWAKHHGALIEAKAYALDILIQLDRSRRGRKPDLDNFCKVTIDSLVHCGIITDDVLVTDISLHKQDGDCDQTTFTIRALR